MSDSTFIPVNEPLLDGKERQYLLECIDSGWISSEGPFVVQFEQEFAKKVGRKHGIAVSSGSAAIDVAVESLELKPGDEVIMPSFTIISCITQIIRSGLIPVLVDSDPNTWNMDATQIESKITSRTKAIMIVHIYGLPVDIDPVLDVAKSYDLKIIEDAAEMHGQTYRGKPCGSFGDISTFSFYPNKHITTGEGGMIVTDDNGLEEKCRSLRNLCFEQKKRFVHDRLGWNYRMTNMQAALGLAQMERLNEFIIRKREMGKLYEELLTKVENIQLPLNKTDYAENIYWVFGIVLNDKTKINAQTAMYSLGKKGIGTRPFFYPMHKQPILKKMGLFKGENYSIAENISQNGFYIPSGLAITKEQIICVANAVREVLQ